MRREPQIWRTTNDRVTEKFVRYSEHGDQLWQDYDYPHQLAFNAFGNIVVYIGQPKVNPLEITDIMELACIYGKHVFEHRGTHPPAPEIMAQAEFLASLKGV